jgi:eukaryotic-like serine/threonine-protein kinase
MSQGSKLGERYRLVRKVGSGGMGRVWLAHDEMLHRDVAVKEVVLPEELTQAEREELFQRTMREARAAGRLNHPNVVAIYDVVLADNRPWIVMEMVRSRSLYEVIKGDGPLSPKRAAEIGLYVLAALKAAHAKGVWHRDVKPGNVLLADDGRVVLTDFGLATFDGDGTVTRPGLILGSAQYISPERAREGTSSPASDLWSLGATLYAAVEGRSPFARESSMATLTALATQPPDPPRKAGPLREILLGLLRKNPRHRMSADEAERLLRRVVNGEPMGRRLPRQRVPAEVRVPVGAGEAAASGSGDVAPSADGPRLRTVTEETFRHTTPVRRRWPWIAAALVAVLAAPAAVILLDRRDRSGVISAPVTPSPTVALSAAMGVQACAAQDPDTGEPVRSGATALPGEGTMLEGWIYYRDDAGYHIAVGKGWLMSRVGGLACFRDPTSRRLIGVYEVGQVAGRPTKLLADGEAAWRSAADLNEYRRLDLRDLLLPEGGADLEYAYDDAERVRMHGVNRMVRVQGRVFLIFWLTTQTSWLADRTLMNMVQPSFGVVS